MTAVIERLKARKPRDGSRVPLGELAEFINGAAFKPTDWEGEGRRIIRIQNLNDSTKPFNRTTKDVPEKLKVHPGDLLVSWSASLGVFTWKHDDIAVLNQHIFRVVPDESKVIKAYLRHMLIGALVDMEEHLHGATMKHVNRGEFLSTQIPVPPLDEQRRIAAILDKADKLRTQRRQALAQLDALTQSLFQATVEDAGALLPAMTLADLGLTFSSGKNLISSDGDAHEHNRVIKVNAVSGGVFQPSESKPLPRTYIPNEQHRIRSGDLLFTRASGSLDLIGISARVREAGAHLFLPDKIWRAEFTPGAKVCPEYLQSLFKTPAFRAFVNNAASGAAGVKNISQRSVLGFVVSAPEPAAQEEFAKHVSAIELLKDRHSAQLAELDALFGVLQHRAFKGEL